MGLFDGDYKMSGVERVEVDRSRAVDEAYATGPGVSINPETDENGEARYLLSRVAPDGVETEIAVFGIERFAHVCRERLQMGLMDKRIEYRVTPLPAAPDENRVTVDRDDLETVLGGPSIEVPMEEYTAAFERLRAALSDGRKK